MIWIDYVIISTIIFSALVSLKRGFMYEVLSLVIWVCAFFITKYYYSYFIIYFNSFQQPIIREGIAITLLFVLSLIVGMIINHTISAVLERTNLSGINRILGVCFGVIRGILIISTILYYLNIFTNFSHSRNWRHSQLIPQFEKIIRWFLTIYKIC